jgi:hypothetical protein
MAKVMTKQEWDEFESLMQPVDLFLNGNLAQVRRLDEITRADKWSRFVHTQNEIEERFAGRLMDQVLRDTQSRFAFARLLLAAAAKANHEDSPMTEHFTEDEFSFLVDFEGFSAIDDMMRISVKVPPVTLQSGHVHGAKWPGGRSEATLGSKLSLAHPGPGFQCLSASFLCR